MIKYSRKRKKLKRGRYEIAMSLIKTKSFELAILTRGDTDSKKVTILIPGRLDTKDYGNFISHAEYLSNKGFFAVAFDPPGTWDSPGRIDLYTTTNYLKALNELIEYFGDRPTLLVGHSRGAAVAAVASMSNPAIIGIVLLMANYGSPTSPSEEDLNRGFKVSHRDLPPGTSPASEQKEFLLPINYWKDGKQYNQIEVLEKCTKPKLLIYGTEDEFTSPNTVEELFKNIPEPKMIKEVNSNHDYRYHPEIIEEVNYEIGLFLDKYFE